MSVPAVRSDAPAIRGGKPLFDHPFRFMAPSLPDLDDVVASYRRCYARGLITNSALVSRFEAAAAERLQVRYCIAVSSCTSGLMILLRALGLKGEVILPSFTFFASGHALLWNSLVPVFADCDPVTWTIDPGDVEKRITNRTSAIMGVHVYGNPCEVDKLAAIASRHHLKLVFDAAHAFGSIWQGRPVGQFGDAEVFSLSPTKTLVSGEGGLITTGDSVLAERLRAARNYGDSGSYDCEVLGLNARMSEFHAALGLATLDIVDRKIQRQNQIAARYWELLKSHPGIDFQTVRNSNVSTFKDYSILVGPELGATRDEFTEALLAENIETRKYFHPPLHRQKLYRSFWDSENTLPNTETISERVLSLPIYESLSDKTVETVAYAILRIAGYGVRLSESAA